MLTPEQIAVQKRVELGHGTKAQRLWSDGLISWEELQSGRFDDTAPLERRLISVAEIAAHRAAIQDAPDDPEAQECLARSMMLDVLYTIATGQGDATQLAEAALAAHRATARRLFDSEDDDTARGDYAY